MLSPFCQAVLAMPVERRSCASFSAYFCRPTEAPHGRSFCAAWTMRMAAVLSAPAQDGLLPPTVRGLFAWSTLTCVHRDCRVCLGSKCRTPSPPHLLHCAIGV